VFIRVHSWFIGIGIIAVVGEGGAITRQSRSHASILLPLRPYVKEVVNELDRMSGDRKVVVGEIAAHIAARLEAGKAAKLTFICTHNSRRSHMSQIWAQTAAYYYGLDKVYAFSGGTDATACNCRTVTAMRRAGFSIKDATAGDKKRFSPEAAEGTA